MKELHNFINGTWRSSTEVFDKSSPFDGRLVARVHVATDSMIDEAVMAGRRAVETGWGRMPLRARAQILRDLSRALMARMDDLVEADMADTGRSLWQARNFDGARAIRQFDAYCDLALAMENRSASFTGSDGAQGLWYTQQRPRGVIACIAPWNMPLLLMIMKLAPALVMGNAAIAKPSEETPGSATVLAEVIAQSEVPDGAFALLHGAGATGAALTAHPGVDAISFTGASATGSAIMRSAATGLREVALELGGKNPALVFEDADVEAAIAGTARSAFFNCGQICFCTERAYVHRSHFDAFVEGISQAARKVVIGEPAHDGFSIGPLISQGHRAKVRDLLDSVTADGGAFVAGGGVPRFGDSRDAGAFIEPSVAVGLAPEARFLREEVFGPVLHVAPFDSEDEAIALANDTEYGLASVIWTENVHRAHRVASQLRAGHVWLNAWQFRDLASPLAGAGLSGVGEQFGRSSLEFCTQPQTVTLRVAPLEETV
ncbi:aldehyde dehydrogenase family protein [Alkalilacustris brevis]|uniref:aldehyde dehydrogenase family protein n=1 Tax=Alkalilacustris brevis TaxID=2026338 RepID=UPI000E0DF0C3|nr:aldehyde dehydrogenase family protein [Alkalilacustris brevis]